MLQQDHYYKNFPHLSLEERARQNFDHPDAFDNSLFIEHVGQLREGRPIDRPVYDFTKHERASETVRMNPSPALILEGILIFENKALCELMDIKIFVDTDADLRFIRRLSRDIRERGRTVDSVVNQYLTTVRPMHNEFVEPSKRHADVIIPERPQRSWHRLGHSENTIPGRFKRFLKFMFGEAFLSLSLE